MTEIRTTIVGNLTGDPELRFTQSGVAVANFTVAVNHRKKQAEQWVDDGATFIRCAAWRDLAESVAGNLTKGQRVTATGDLRAREYDRSDGTKGLSLDLSVDEIGPTLAKFKQGKPSATPAENAAAWGAPAPTQQTGGAAWGQTEAPF